MAGKLDPGGAGRSGGAGGRGPEPKWWCTAQGTHLHSCSLAGVHLQQFTRWQVHRQAVATRTCGQEGCCCSWGTRSAWGPACLGGCAHAACVRQGPYILRCPRCPTRPLERSSLNVDLKASHLSPTRRTCAPTATWAVSCWPPARGFSRRTLPRGWWWRGRREGTRWCWRRCGGNEDPRCGGMVGGQRPQAVTVRIWLRDGIREPWCYATQLDSLPHPYTG